MRGLQLSVWCPGLLRPAFNPRLPPMAAVAACTTTDTAAFHTAANIMQGRSIVRRAAVLRRTSLYRQPYYNQGPSVGRNGQVSCGNPNYTFQDGACRPYRGP